MKYQKVVFVLAFATLLCACADKGEWPVTEPIETKSNAAGNYANKDFSCMGRLDPYATAEMIELTDPETLYDEYDAQARVNRIAELFRDAEDPRGLFATVYRLITNRAVESAGQGAYEHPEWARNLITEFARRYLRNLHGHLIGGEITGQWKKYYNLAENCKVGRGRTLGVAIAVHLMVDLPKTLYAINSMPEQREDFVVFGEILLEIFDQLIIDIERDYHTDVTDLLRGFFFGKWVDSFTRVGNMTEFIYQGVRLKAWRDSQNYRKFPRRVVDLEVRLAWGAAEVLLAHLDAVDVL